jgi:thioester reductase-like protein/aryl carrier-like protein
LVHVSGEKSNALAIEAMLLSKLGEWIAHAAVIGAGRLRLAVILQWKREPSEADHAALSRGLAAINAELPAHSHLHEDLLLLLPAGDRRLPLTPKKTVARNKAEVEFRAELERLYAGTTVASAGASLLSFFDRPEALDRNVSLFKQGLNSLQAAGLRNHIAKLYPGRDIPLNLIFQQPTLAALEQFLIGNAAAQRTPPEFPPFTPDQLSRAQWEYPVPRHVLLTGASGFIGRHLLDALCARAHVERVYCPIRSGSRGLPVHPKVTVLPGYDLSDPHFGLGADTYQALLGKVDTIVHAAWPVNFNISYAEMADATLASVRHLVTFAERGDKALHFISSAATVSIQPESRKGARVEEQWPQPTARASLARGYAQTKWEAEHILIRSGVRFKIFRLGQVSAHSVTQQWNDLEYIPILLRATRAIGSTPLLPLPIDWVPVDIAVQALVELMTVAGKNIHHIANPHLRPAEVMARGTPCLPLQQWLTEVEPRLPEHGALMTLWSFLHDLVTWGAHMRVLGVQQTCADSPALAACEPISDSYLERLPY